MHAIVLQSQLNLSFISHEYHGFLKFVKQSINTYKYYKSVKHLYADQAVEQMKVPLFFLSVQSIFLSSST